MRPEALRAMSSVWDETAAKAREAPLRFSTIASHLLEWPPRQYEVTGSTGKRSGESCPTTSGDVKSSCDGASA